MLLFVSCQTLKDTRAVKRVTANRDLLDKVFVEGLKIHPCANDTTIVNDTTYTNIVTDTIRSEKLDTIVVEVTRTITKERIVEKIISDEAKIGILNDTIVALKIQSAKKDVLVYAKGELVKKRNKTIWWLGGVIALLGVALIVKKIVNGRR